MSGELLFSNWFISSAIMGRLSLAKQIPLALSNALGVFSNIFSSALTKVFASDGNNKLIDEANSQLKILTVFFTVPYAGIIVFGYNFLLLWLNDTNYTEVQYIEIYVLMILVLLDIIISTYMYSIHSIFIAIDKVKVYSVILFISSVISISTTLVLLKFTELGAYAIAGTSTVILGLTHGVVVPACAAKLLDKPLWIFWKTELKSWASLTVLCVTFSLMKNVMVFSSWICFFSNIAIAGLIGYFLEFSLTFNKCEKGELIDIIKDKFSYNKECIVTYKNQDKMIVYSFWMTILIVIYHLAPHLIDISVFRGGRYYKQFFETFGPIALNYFFAASAYKFFVSEKSYKDKLKKRIITLIIPYIVWNSIYIFLYVLQNGMPNFNSFILGYTLKPFDGPLWYIFVLYIYFIFFSFSVKINSEFYKIFKWSIIPLSLAVALFHNAVITSIISFPYDWWVERALRMLPPFLYGVYFAKNKTIVHRSCKYDAMISGMISIICFSLSTFLGDGAFTTLLMYVCTIMLWKMRPNITLQSKSIIRNDMFTIYALHEGIIVVLLALFNKANIILTSYISLIFVMIIEIVIIITIGFVFNACLRRLPSSIDIMFTGGRNHK